MYIACSISDLAKTGHFIEKDGVGIFRYKDFQCHINIGEYAVFMIDPSFTFEDGVVFFGIYTKQRLIEKFTVENKGLSLKVNDSYGVILELYGQLCDLEC